MTKGYILSFYLLVSEVHDACKKNQTYVEKLNYTHYAIYCIRVICAHFVNAIDVELRPTITVPTDFPLNVKTVSVLPAST